VKFVADMGISMTTVHALRESGEEVVHLRDQGLLTLPDDQILEKAIAERRVALTFDLDFGDLLAASGSIVPSVILFRMRNQTPGAVTPRLCRALDTCRTAARSS
jgi:predicted nuclease of predicted toxin-antitoxin system